eukprot:31198-Pelagococcus_subviridis.AAC.30
MRAEIQFRVRQPRPRPPPRPPPPNRPPPPRPRPPGLNPPRPPRPPGLNPPRPPLPPLNPPLPPLPPPKPPPRPPPPAPPPPGRTTSSGSSSQTRSELVRELARDVEHRAFAVRAQHVRRRSNLRRPARGEQQRRLPGVRRQERARSELAVTGEFRQRRGEHLRRIRALVVLARAALEELLRGVHEHLRRALGHRAHLRDDNLRGRGGHLRGLRRRDSLKLKPALALDVRDRPLVPGRAERHAFARRAAAPGASAPVNVRLRFLRRFALHDELDAADVEPARGDVRCDQRLELVRPEPGEDDLALGLVHVAVERLRALLELLLQRLLELAAVALGVAEHDDAAVPGYLRADQVAHELGALAPLAVQKHVGHGCGRLLFLVPDEVHGDVVGLKEPSRDVRDPLRQRRAEQQRLKFLVILRVVQDHLYVLHEPHVQHLVRLVQNAEAELIEAQRLAFQMILHPPRGADDDVASRAQQPLLVPVRRAAVHAYRRELERVPDVLKVRVDLLRELARRREQRDDGGSALRAATVRWHRVFAVDRLDDREDERERLPAPRLRSRDDVFPVEDVLERLRLDAVQRRDPFRLQARAHLSRDVKVGDAQRIVLGGRVLVRLVGFRRGRRRRRGGVLRVGVRGGRVRVRGRRVRGRRVAVAVALAVGRFRRLFLLLRRERGGGGEVLLELLLRLLRGFLHLRRFLRGLDLLRTRRTFGGGGSDSRRAGGGAAEAVARFRSDSRLPWRRAEIRGVSWPRARDASGRRRGRESRSHLALALAGLLHGLGLGVLRLFDLRGPHRVGTRWTAAAARDARVENTADRRWPG